MLLKSTCSIFRFGSTQLKTGFRKHSQKYSHGLTFERLQDNNEGIAVIGFNRPKQKNALSTKLIEELQDAVNQVSYDDSFRVLVFRSLVPGIFCAGADLKERASMPQADVLNAVNNIRNITQKIYNIPIPVIAAVDGLALGGGLEIALACDIRIVSRDTKLGLVETKLAIIPGAGGTQRLSRLVNPSVAKELIFTAKILDADKAKELGIVNHTVEQNETEDAAYLKALEIAQEILPNGPIAIRMAKAAINKGHETDIVTGLAIEEACYAQVIPTSDRTEGLEAFREKRKPQYRGL